MRAGLVVCCESQRKAAPYLDALTGLGVDAQSIVLLTPDDSHQDLAALAKQSAGIVLCGGPDLDPSWYGEEPRPDANLSLLPELDKMDWQLLVGAELGRSPVWAICRGMQIFNVFQGGTLFQDLKSQVEDVLDHRPDTAHDTLAHTISVTDRDDSFAALLAAEPTEVNSRHHQAVCDLGREIRPLAQSPDGVLEVLALDRQDWWVKGVQWHPENLMHIPLQRRLWIEFLTAADNRAAKSGTAPLVG